jgi:ABC-type transport system substrate-binding protein
LGGCEKALSEEGTELTLPLRAGVAWHDGKPFTAKDVQCTFDMLTGKSSDKLRVNPRKSWYRNLARGIGGENGGETAFDGLPHWPPSTPAILAER